MALGGAMLATTVTTAAASNYHHHQRVWRHLLSTSSNMVISSSQHQQQQSSSSSQPLYRQLSSSNDNDNGLPPAAAATPALAAAVAAVLSNSDHNNVTDAEESASLVLSPATSPHGGGGDGNGLVFRPYKDHEEEEGELSFHGSTPDKQQNLPSSSTASLSSHPSYHEGMTTSGTATRGNDVQRQLSRVSGGPDNDDNIANDTPPLPHAYLRSRSNSFDDDDADLMLEDDDDDLQIVRRYHLDFEQDYDAHHHHHDSTMNLPWYQRIIFFLHPPPAAARPRPTARLLSISDRSWTQTCWAGSQTYCDATDGGIALVAILLVTWLILGIVTVLGRNPRYWGYGMLAVVVRLGARPCSACVWHWWWSNSTVGWRMRRRRQSRASSSSTARHHSSSSLPSYRHEQLGMSSWHGPPSQRPSPNTVNHYEGPQTIGNNGVPSNDRGRSGGVSSPHSSPLSVGNNFGHQHDNNDDDVSPIGVDHVA